MAKKKDQKRLKDLKICKLQWIHRFYSFVYGNNHDSMGLPFHLAYGTVGKKRFGCFD